MNSFDQQHKLAKYIQHVTPYTSNLGNDHLVLYLILDHFNGIKEDKAYY